MNGNEIGKTSAHRHASRLAGKRCALLFACVGLLASGCATTDASRPARGMRGEAIFTLSASADRAYRESRWIDAARDYQLLTEKVPDDAWAWFRLGNVHAKQGDFDAAILAYQTSLDRNGHQAKPWFNLATAYLLNARLAMSRAREQLHSDDPVAQLIDQRLQALQSIIHERIEDDGHRAALLPARAGSARSYRHDPGHADAR